MHLNFFLNWNTGSNYIVVWSLAIWMLFSTGGEARAGAFDGSRFKQGMVYGLTDIDQNSMRFCTGSLFGLNDDKNRVILPKKYSDIEYCGHGLFLTTDVQKWNKYYFGDKRHFFNRDGVELDYKLPDKAFLLNIFSFGEQADLEPNQIMTKFQPDTILLFGYRGEPESRQMGSMVQGLCNLKGEVLFKTVSGTVLFLKPGSAFIVRNTNDSTILNLKNLSESPTKLQRNPGSIPVSRIHWPSNYQVEMPFPKDRLRTQLFTDHGLFDHDYWCEQRNYPIQAMDMFNRFLHDYDLIGMFADRVDTLLGEPTQNVKWQKNKESRTYAFPSVGCVPHFSGIKTYTENERIMSWSFVEGDPLSNDGKMSETPKITTNVVLKRPKQMMDKRLVNGRIGEQNESWPEVEAKYPPK